MCPPTSINNQENNTQTYPQAYLMKAMLHLGVRLTRCVKLTTKISGQGQRDEHLLLETSSGHTWGRAAMTPEAVSHSVCDAHMYVPLLHSRQLPHTWRRTILVAKRNQSKPAVPGDECSLSLCLVQYHSFWPWMLPRALEMWPVQWRNQIIISFHLD